MKCPWCGRKTDVLQTFTHETHVVRVKGHRDQENCWWRSRTIERFEDNDAPSHRIVSEARQSVLELSEIISELKDFDRRMKKSLGLVTLASVLDTEDSEIHLVPSSE